MRTILAIAALSLTACAPTRPARPPASAAEPIQESTTPARRSAVLSAEPWTYENADGQTVRTRHYRIFTTETDPLLAGRLPSFLEDALQHYRTAITPLPPPDLRLDCYLMDNRPQWARLTQRLLGSRAAPFLRIRRGGFATRGVGVYYDLGPFDTLAIAAHEGWHQYTQRVFKDRLPTWLEEGIAAYMEGHRWKGDTPVFLPWANMERFDRLRAARAGGAILPLEDFLAASGAASVGEDSGLDFYAQAWALTHFLAQERRPGLARLLGDAAEGRLTRNARAFAQRRPQPIRSQADLSRALFEAYFADLATAQREFDAFLDAVTRPGARDEAAAGRSPAR